MPQLNPAHWFFTFFTAWAIFFSLLFLITKTATPAPPTKSPYLATPCPWKWP